MLQEKINSYLSFVESGEINKKFPQAHSLKVTINVVGQFPLSKQASAFFQRARAAIENAGFALEFKLHHPH
jgi:hypothetical protein